MVLAFFLQYKGLHFPSTADSGTTGSFFKVQKGGGGDDNTKEGVGGNYNTTKGLDIRTMRIEILSC